MERVLISTQVWQQPSPSPSSSELYGCEVAVSPDLWQAILEQANDGEPVASTSSVPASTPQRLAVCLSPTNTRRRQSTGQLQSIVCWATKNQFARAGKASGVSATHSIASLHTDIVVSLSAQHLHHFCFAGSISRPSWHFS